MAQITLNHPIAEIHGALSKRSNIVNRQKKYRINGRVIHEGKQESYAIQTLVTGRKPLPKEPNSPIKLLGKRLAAVLLKSCKPLNPKALPLNNFSNAVLVKSPTTTLWKNPALC